MIWRYDLILINDYYSIDYHIKQFRELAKILSRYTETVVISFIDIYHKIKRQAEKLHDIGIYNSCLHKCKYCYANYSENVLERNVKRHNLNSPMLIGELIDDETIKDRIK